jgi:hypothetical protein
MDDIKRKRLVKLKQETAESCFETKLNKPPRVEIGIFGERIIKRSADYDLWAPQAYKLPIAVAPTPTPAQPIIPKAVQALVPETKPITAEPPPRPEPPKERLKIYKWSEGYCLASGKAVDHDSHEYRNAERFKIFRPPNRWIAKTEDGTAREYLIAVELDVWDRTELKRVNKVLSHDKNPIIVSPYGVL